MAGQQFNALISCFYVGYVLMQIPSYVCYFTCYVTLALRSRRNIFLNQLNRPSVYISCCVFLWGIISISIGQYSLCGFHDTLQLFSGASQRLVGRSWVSYRLSLVVFERPLYPGSYLASRRQCSTLELYSCSLHGNICCPSSRDIFPS